jgi:hypothetical protein
MTRPRHPQPVDFCFKFFASTSFILTLLLGYPPAVFGYKCPTVELAGLWLDVRYHCHVLQRARLRKRISPDQERARARVRCLSPQEKYVRSLSIRMMFLLWQCLLTPPLSSMYASGDRHGVIESIVYVVGDGSQSAGDKCMACFNANLECTYLETAAVGLPIGHLIFPLTHSIYPSLDIETPAITKAR